MKKPFRPRAFLVGAPKAGTSALARYLASHPEISVSSIKEPNYFAPDLDLPGPKSEAEYLSLFALTSATRILLDASILYLYSRTAPQAIAKYTNEPRIIIVLREPVEAMYAWHEQMVFTANEPLNDFRAALDAEIERKRGRLLPTAGAAARCPSLLFYRDVMRYSDQIERYLAVFDREHIHVLLYEDFRENPAGSFRRIAEFLGVDPAFTPEFAEVNLNKVRRSWLLHFWLKRAFAAPARALLPAQVRLNLISFLDRWNSREERRAPLVPWLREELRAECRSDVERLGRLIQRDLSSWIGQS